jgi:CHAT domain-containing protein
VVWRDEDIITDLAQKVRASETKTKKKTEKPLNVLHIEMSLEGEKLSISVYEQLVGETSTVRHYEDMNVSMARIETRCQEMVETLNRANRRGRLTREVLVKLREAGQVLHDELFTLNVKGKLKETKAEYLNLNLDDKLVHVPWELLNDGHQFLCRRFNIGRFVKTRQTVGTSKTRLLEHPLKMFILADPTSDLKGAYLEGTKIRDYMDQDKNLINATLRSDGITPEFVREKIRNFDLFHFAGHAEYNPHNPGESGLELSNGRLKAQDIIKMGGTAAMPALIFSNACQSYWMNQAAVLH